MKLPLDDSAGQGDGGHRDPAAEESSGRSGGGEVGNGQAAAANGSANGGPTGPEQPDFSEYLWMEHEEEFDEQVLRELEDEEMLHYYYDLYEASVAEEEAKRNSSSRSNNNDSHPNSSSNHRQAPASSHETPNCSIRIPGPNPPYNRAPRNNYQNDGLGEITRGLDRVSVSSSRLNPNAAEFVPRAVERSPGQDSHHLT